MKVQFLGAAGTVTGSCLKIEHRGFSLLVDCGLFQGPREVRERNWRDHQDLRGVSAVILTHAHIDHSGLLPLLPKLGFSGPIYCSAATADLCGIMLPDSGRLQEEDARFLNQEKATHFDPALPLYTEKQALEVLKLFEPVPSDEWIPLFPGLEFRLRRSGHILGSRFVEIRDDRTQIAVSGDLGTSSPVLLKEAVRIAETDHLVLESTYGDRCHDKGDRLEQLARVVREVIWREGTLMIPAFSVGRTQDLLFLLSRLEKEGRIPRVPVYLDSPMARDATEIYLRHQDELRPEFADGRTEDPLHSARFQAVRDPDESMLLCMDTSPKIVISAAGMLNGGRILHHLRAKLPDPKSGVLFVGYQVPGTKGDLLKNGLPKVRIHHKPVDVEAGIYSMDSLSAHADSEEIVSWCRGFRRPPLLTSLVHGEDGARRALAYRLRHELGWNVHLPSEGERLEAPERGFGDLA